MNSKSYQEFSKLKKETNRKIRLNGLIKLYKENPDDKKIMITLVKTLGDFQEYRPKAKELMKLIASQNNYYSNYLYLGKMELKDNNLDKAKEAFLKGLELDPDNLLLLFEIGKIEKRLQNYDEAQKYFKRILDFGYDKGAVLELGKIKAALGDYKRAKLLFKSILARNENKEALYELGKLYLIENNLDLAETSFLKALKIAENKQESYVSHKNFLKKVYLGLARLELKRENPLKSREYLKPVLKIEKDSQFLAELAKTYYYTKDYEIAKNILTNINDSQKDDVIFREQAKLEARCGDYEKAKETLAKQDFANANAKTTLDLITPYLKTNDIEAALYLYIKFLDKHAQSSKKLHISSIRRIETYLKYQLGILSEDSSLMDYQYARQLTNYNKNQTIDFSSNHFSVDTDIEKLIEDVKANLNSETLTFVRDASDIYQMELETPLKDNQNQDIKYIEVATIINTDKILSVYPIKETSTLKKSLPKIKVRK